MIELAGTFTDTGMLGIVYIGEEEGQNILFLKYTSELGYEVFSRGRMKRKNAISTTKKLLDIIFNSIDKLKVIMMGFPKDNRVWIKEFDIIKMTEKASVKTLLSIGRKVCLHNEVIKYYYNKNYASFYLNKEMLIRAIRNEYQKAIYHYEQIIETMLDKNNFSS